MKRPHILYLHSHDTGRYVQPYGYGVPAPGIQRLAEQGVLFRQAFCAGPTCSASRAALLTGQSPHSSGMLGLAHRGFRLHDYQQHLVHTLRAAGYRTVLGGFQHVARDAAQIGYDELLQPENCSVSAVTPRVIDFLRRDHQQPFFLSVGFSETHRPFHEPGLQQDPRYCRPPAPLPDTPETRRDMAAFMSSVQVYDRGVKMVLDGLDGCGLGEDTLVICTTDHGIAFPGMKCQLTDHGLGVMLILRGPGGFAGGRVCDALVSHIDIFPTLCELLQVPPPGWLQGESLLPLMRDEVEEVNDAIFAEVTYHAAYEPQRAVRTRRWKYIRRWENRGRPVLPNCDDSPSKTVWVDHGWGEHSVRPEQLYDLVFDPNEAHDRSTDPGCAEVLAVMRQRLSDWMARTADPLLAGELVPAPAGALVNDADGLSPQEEPRVVPG